MSTYTFYWENGCREVLTGEYPAGAATHSKIDQNKYKYFWENGEDKKWCWNAQQGKWDRINPILIKTDERFAKSEIYTGLVKTFSELGFDFVSSANVSTDTFNYFINSCYPARCTVLVFTLPTFPLFLVLTHHEHVYVDNNYFYSYWSLRIDAKLTGWTTRYLEPFDELDFEGVATSDSDKPHISSMHHCGWSSRDGIGNYVWNMETNEMIITSESVSFLASNIVQGIQCLIPYLEAGPITESILSWAPDYSFKGSEQFFWQQFNLSKLYPLITSRSYIEKKLTGI